MAYIGVDINYGNIAKQTGTGDGSDTTPIAALTYTAPSNESILVFLDGVCQVPGTDFTATGTTLTFTTAPANGVAILVIFLGRNVDIGTPGDGTVTLAKMAVNSIDSNQYVDLSIDTIHIGNDQITLAKMAGGTDGNIISYDASGDPVAIATGNDGQVLTSTGAGSPPAFEAAGGITLGTPVASTSGTTIDFTSIPAGTKRITVSFLGVSEASSQGVEVVLGDSSGFETTGYLNTVTDIETTVDHDDFTDAFSLTTAGGYSSDNNITGTITLVLENSSSFTWIAQTTVMRHAADAQYIGNGSKSLSAELTQVRIQTSGGSAFDAGEINISYE